MADPVVAPLGAPASREQINAALSGPKDVKGYANRKLFRAWLADDKDGAKAAWLKGS